MSRVEKVLKLSHTHELKLRVSANHNLPLVAASCNALQVLLTSLRYKLWELMDTTVDIGQVLYELLRVHQKCGQSLTRRSNS